MSKALMKREFWRQVLYDLEHQGMDIDRAARVDHSNPVEEKRAAEAEAEIKAELRRKCRME